MTVHELFRGYKTTFEGRVCYVAGLPGYPRNFSRDTILAGLIAADRDLLDNQVAISFQHQGKKYDWLTGEEPGKIHHEYPGVVFREPYLTTYNACDTTALYLIALEFLSRLRNSEPTNFISTYRASIEAAVDYLSSHIKDNIFKEYPPEGARQYSLRVTYWKDSLLPLATGKDEPDYPVAYALAHFQAARGVLAAAGLLNSSDLRDLAGNMFTTGISKFISGKAFCMAEDSAGRYEQVSSDELHALAYIPTDYSEQLPLQSLRVRARDLVTEAGIACTPKIISDGLWSAYHGYVVWVFEQAMIHYGAAKFGLNDISDIAQRCVPHIGNGHELLAVTPHISPSGNDRQLWSVAAKIYFSKARSLRQTKLL